MLKGWPQPLGIEGIEAIMLRTISPQPSLWEAILPEIALRMPAELEAVDALLDDPAFFEPYRKHFDPIWGRPSIPIETYLRMMFLKHRYRLGYESLCREVGDSIAWMRFCRIPFGSSVPHPTTLMKITTRCGEATIKGLNDALVKKAADARVLKLDKARADTAASEAIAVVVNTRRKIARDGLKPGCKLGALLADLETLLGRTAQVVAQTRLRLSGTPPEGATRLVSLHDPDARPIKKGRLGRPVEFGYKAQVIDNADGVVLDYRVVVGNPADAGLLAPAVARIKALLGKVPRALTADRGYGEAGVEADLQALGVKKVAIPRKGKPSAARREVEHRRGFRKLVKWRTGCEGRISHLKHGCGWDRTLLGGIGGAGTRGGLGGFVQNGVKIAPLMDAQPASKGASTPKTTTRGPDQTATRPPPRPPSLAEAC